MASHLRDFVAIFIAAAGREINLSGRTFLVLAITLFCKRINNVYIIGNITKILDITVKEDFMTTHL